MVAKPLSWHALSPIVRTFAPSLQEWGNANYYYFMVYNLVGGAVW